MTLFQAAILGAIQGITEFLPVSSSAHLVITQYLFGLKGNTLLVFDVVVHAGTLSAILVFFRKDLFPLTKIGKRMCGLVVLATLPTAIIGFAFKGWFETFFMSLQPVAFALLINSVILWSTSWFQNKKSDRSVDVKSALFIGVMQGFAIIPGISRSGATISAGIWNKVDRGEAVRFSFLIAIPAILGAILIVLPVGISVLPETAIMPLIVGFVCSFVSGYISISILFHMVLNRELHYFALYTLLLSAISFYFSGAAS